MYNIIVQVYVWIKVPMFWIYKAFKKSTIY